MNSICIVIRKYDNKFADNVLEIIKQSGNRRIDIVKSNSESVVDYEIRKKDNVSIYTIREFMDSTHVIKPDMDTIIIDADISVSPGWIDKMYQCAYQTDDIATVSPLFAVKENTFGKINNSNYCKAKNPCGRCLYVKGKVIFELQENIFDLESAQAVVLPECNEHIAELGYVHMVVGDVICYLSEINEEEKNQSVAHILPELYHELWEESSRKNILFYSFADFKEGSSNNIGGTQLHLKDLVSQLRYKYNVIVAARDYQDLQVTRYTAEDEYCFRFYIGDPCFEMTFYSKWQKDLLLQIINAFHIDIIHVQHLLGMAHDIFEIAEKLHIPVIMTVHDFYYICPLWRLINLDKEICTPAADAKMCALCLKQYKGYGENTNCILRWRSEYRNVVQRCSKIVFPSYSAKDIFTSFYPEALGKEVIIEHGINKKIFDKIGVCNFDNDTKGKIRIAFIGGISEIKGGELIYNLINKSGSDIEWHLLGGNSYKPLLKLKKKNIKYAGWYNRENLQKILCDKKIDIICILSIVSETYCYALSEAIACGIPVIASDIGALGIRARELECGWLVAPNSSAEEVLGLINKIKNTPDVYRSMWCHVQSIKVRGIEEMAEEYANIYGLFDKHISFENFDVFEIISGKTEEKYRLIVSEKNGGIVDKLLKEREKLMNSVFYKVWHTLAMIYDAVRRRLLIAGKNIWHEER